MKIQKGITLEVDTIKRYQSLINEDPKLKGNFSEAIETLIERDIQTRKNLNAQIKIPCLSEHSNIQTYVYRQTEILSFCEKSSSERYQILQSLDHKSRTKIAIVNRETRDQLNHIWKSQK